MAAAGLGGFSDEEGGGLIADINVTPLVDITLVLLIIMMVAAPIIANNPSIKVDLPKAASGDETQKTTLSITLTKVKLADGNFGHELYFNGEKIDEGRLTSQLTELVKQKTDIQAVIASDRGVPYGDVMHILDLVKTLGITKFALATDGT